MKIFFRAVNCLVHVQTTVCTTTISATQNNRWPCSRAIARPSPIPSFSTLPCLCRRKSTFSLFTSLIRLYDSCVRKVLVRIYSVYCMCVWADQQTVSSSSGIWLRISACARFAAMLTRRISWALPQILITSRVVRIICLAKLVTSSWAVYMHTSSLLAHCFMCVCTYRQWK